MNADNRIFKRKLYERMLNWKHTWCRFYDF